MHTACELSNGKTSMLREPLYVYNKDNSLLYSNSYYNASSRTKRIQILDYIRNLPVCRYAWPRTYIIHLSKDVPKKQKMMQQLEWMQNSNFTFIEGVDGNAHESEVYHEYVRRHQSKELILPKTKLYYNPTRQHITPSSLGLLESVFLVLRQFVESNSSHMVLFEDDVFTHKELPYYFFLHEQGLKDKDLVYLGCHHNQYLIYQYVNDQDVWIDVKQIPFLLYGSYSMIVSQSLAKFILSFGLESIVRMNLSWDLFLNYVREKYEFTCYVYFKELFIPDVCKEGINGYRDMTFYTNRKMDVTQYHTQWS